MTLKGAMYVGQFFRVAICIIRSFPKMWRNRTAPSFAKGYEQLGLSEFLWFVWAVVVTTVFPASNSNFCCTESLWNVLNWGRLPFGSQIIQWVSGLYPIEITRVVSPTKYILLSITVGYIPFISHDSWDEPPSIPNKLVGHGQHWTLPDQDISDYHRQLLVKALESACQDRLVSGVPVGCHIFLEVLALLRIISIRFYPLICSVFSRFHSNQLLKFEWFVRFSCALPNPRSWKKGVQQGWSTLCDREWFKSALMLLTLFSCAYNSIELRVPWNWEWLGVAVLLFFTCLIQWERRMHEENEIDQAHGHLDAKYTLSQGAGSNRPMST